MNDKLKERIREFNRRAEMATADGYTVADGYVWEGWGNPTGPCARKVCKVEDYERWNQRADPDPDWCPFCGCEAVEFDGIMNYSTFFADAYCPDCRVRFEFQKAKKGKVESNNLKKARKAFGKRVQA